jgi:O-antigen ligase
MLLLVAVCAIPIWTISQVSGKTNVSSLETHMSDAIAGFSSFLNSPFSGHGIGNYADSFIQFGGGSGQTSGILSMAAQGGLLLLCIYLIPLCGMAYRALQTRKLNDAAFACILLLCFTIIVVDNNPLFVFYLAFGISYCYTASKKDSLNARFLNRSATS